MKNYELWSQLLFSGSHNTILTLVTYILTPAASDQAAGQPPHSKQARCRNTCTYKSTKYSKVLAFPDTLSVGKIIDASSALYNLLTVCAFTLALAPIKSSATGK